LFKYLATASKLGIRIAKAYKSAFKTTYKKTYKSEYISVNKMTAIKMNLSAICNDKNIL